MPWIPSDSERYGESIWFDMHGVWWAVTVVEPLMASCGVAVTCAGRDWMSQKLPMLCFRHELRVYHHAYAIILAA